MNLVNYIFGSGFNTSTENQLTFFRNRIILRATKAVLESIASTKLSNVFKN